MVAAAVLALRPDFVAMQGLKLGVKKIYVQTFDKLRGTLDKAQASGTEIQAMLGGTFRQLNAEFGFSLQVPTPPQLEHFTHDLNQIEQSHLQYLGVGNALKLAQPEFAERLAAAVAQLNVGDGLADGVAEAAAEKTKAADAAFDNQGDEAGWRREIDALAALRTRRAEPAAQTARRSALGVVTTRVLASSGRRVRRLANSDSFSARGTMAICGMRLG